MRPQPGSTRPPGAATSSPRSGPGKEESGLCGTVPAGVISLADRTLRQRAHGLDRKTRVLLELGHPYQEPGRLKPPEQGEPTFSINDAASHTRWPPLPLPASCVQFLASSHFQPIKSIFFFKGGRAIFFAQWWLILYIYLPSKTLYYFYHPSALF